MQMSFFYTSECNLFKTKGLEFVVLFKKIVLIVGLFQQPFYLIFFSNPPTYIFPNKN